MPRKKRSSTILKKAKSRFLGLKAIDSNLDFGTGGNLRSLAEQIEQLQAKLDTYNTALTIIDSSKIDIEELERSLSALCARLLLSVAAKYGQDSHEYMMAGGVRTSDRIRKRTSNRSKDTSEEAPIENVEDVQIA